MAALALLMMAGCASDDLATEAPQPTGNQTKTMTLTVGFDDSAKTRSLTSAGVKTFEAGDKVAMVYKNKNGETKMALSSELAATDISDDGKQAKIKVDLDTPDSSQQARLIYPVAMAKTTIATNAEIDDDDATIDFSKLAAQDGTLASLSDNLDLCTFDGILGNMELTEFYGTPKLTNRLAIGKFTIKDYDGKTDLTNTIKSLTITQGTTTYAVMPAAPATTFGDAPLYVAMRPVSNGDFTAIATDGTTNFEKTVTSESLAANSMTPINIKMWKVVELSQFTTDGQEYIAENGEMLHGTLVKKTTGFNVGANVKISIAKDAHIALKDVTILGQPYNIYLWAGLTCKGDATIVLEGTNIVAGFDNNYPGIYVPGDKNDPSKNNTLIIKGTGSLTVGRETSCGACIGSGHVNSINADCGNIEIQGGRIIAKAGYSGAGIGCGDQGSCGSITISGGYVEATGGHCGAGIGSAGNENASTTSTCGDIIISGGTVIAKGTYAAGIGSGYKTSCGNITISGGTIEATGDNNGAGIGSSDTGKCGSIMISDGNITATGGDNGAGIGCGSAPNVSSQCGNITITGGTIKAIANGDVAKIGRGLKNAICGTITFGSAMVYTGDDTSTTPVTSGNWDPNPLTAGNYGGLTLSISTTTTENDTWTLRQ